MQAALELQKAILSALSDHAPLVQALGGAKFHDLTPMRTAYPYVTFGPSSIHDWSTDTEQGSEHFFTLNIWSGAKGKAEALVLIEAVRKALVEMEPAMNGFNLVNLRQESAEIRFDDDLGAHHGLMRFRAVIEPA
ncbi:DUF3168 domain-containing protein [Nitratireductor indicus]|uniref:DUF3168 domain-containing protein n=1 Tax=Nitratireductor indicus C115 TaxID=1231190 RepID=K2P028_9HYPH|nr:DUF3168 domain-containing protein [Nitratireductor indicus]EKF40636.1 hypothetical protein NA8A_19845 [Nitratireductor indicus C115]MDS1134614.1 DUF3168 domain-containing protein [Nitratireductor indicus]SFQ43571.1 Protein of unknown function [Nitratireductor indicus]